MLYLVLFINKVAKRRSINEGTHLVRYRFSLRLVGILGHFALFYAGNYFLTFLSHALIGYLIPLLFLFFKINKAEVVIVENKKLQKGFYVINKKTIILPILPQKHTT